MKIKALAALGVAAALALGISLAVPAGSGGKPSGSINKALCAEKLRYGSEAFHRGRYSEAKRYFREAVQADPGQAKAWALYDLTVLYDVAEQIKRTGRVVKVPGVAVPAAAPAAKAPAAKAPATPSKAPAGVPAVPAVPEDEGC